MKKSIFLPALLLAVLVLSGCMEYCGNGKCELKENNASCSQDCPACADKDKCTADSFDYNLQKCVHSEIVPCCDNGACQEGEDFFKCPEDCEYSLAIASAKQYVIPAGQTVVDVIDVTNNVSRKEKDYTILAAYAELPVVPVDGSALNSKDFIDFNFYVPSSVYEALEGKQVFLEVFFACGEKFDGVLGQYSKFGVLETLQAIKCNDAWEERQIKLRLERPGSQRVSFTIKKLPGEGKAKIDYARVSMKKVKIQS